MRLIICLLFSFLFLDQAYGHDDHKNDDCHKILTTAPQEKPHHLVFSGREGKSERDMLQSYADFLWKEGGILDQLGLAKPKQTIQFLPGSEVNTIAANGRLPIAFWHDGANIANSRRDGLLYEMVIFGGEIQHSIYRDDVPLYQQIAILNHVVGHNHFAVHGAHPGVRVVEHNHAAYSLNAYLDELKEKYSRAEISDWLQYLGTLTMAQDLVSADSETPESLKPTSDNAEKMHLPGVQTASMKNPRHATANILQAFVANLPAHLPDWKKEIARRVELLSRFIPGAFHTKIMNEGFATLLMELIAPYSPYQGIEHWHEFCCLLKGVASKSLSNPYWLGLEGWRNLRKNFNARPEITGLPRLEQDRAFIKYATVEIIQKMGDRDFLRLSLTDNWIQQQNLSLVRPIKYENESDPKLPPPGPDLENPVEYKIVSRDPNRVRSAIIAHLVNFELMYPRPVVSDIGGSGQGIIQLEMANSMGLEISLNRKSLVETLLVMARIMNAPVAIESTFDFATGEIKDDDSWFRPGFGDDWWRKPPQTFARKRVQVIVDLDGKVRAYEVARRKKDSKEPFSSAPDNLQVNGWAAVIHDLYEVKPIPIEIVEEKLQKFANDYIADLKLGQTPQHPFSNLMERRVHTAIATHTDRSPKGLMLRVPTAAEALSEFFTFARSRALDALWLAMQGQRDINHNANGVQVKVLPDIPYFVFNRVSLTRYLGRIPVPRTDLVLQAARLTDDGDLPLDIDNRNGKEGDSFWDEGGRNGEGDGDADQYEDDNDKPDGRRKGKGESEPGSGGIDPTYIQFDLNTYAKLLEQVVELPRLRPLENKTPIRDDVPSGHMQRPNGETVEARVTSLAIEYATNAYRRAGKPLPPSRSQLVREGLKLIPSEEWIVKSAEDIPTPDVNALVVFMMDFSGSFSEFVDKSKQMLYDMRAVLLRKYKHITFRFVAFDGRAYEFEDPDEFFRLELGGGTDYTSGLKSTLEIYEQFPASKWDRYMVLSGDMEDFAGENDELRQAFEKVRMSSNFFASVRMGYGVSQKTYLIEQLLIEAASKDPYVSFVDLGPENNYTPLVLRRLFKNDEKK